MFPNPPDALPLPGRPNLEQYKKLGKELVSVCKAGKPAALREFISDWIGNLIRLSRLEFVPGMPVETERWVEEVTEFATRTLQPDHRRCNLTGAQFVIARSHGFLSWPRMVKHIEQLTSRSSPVTQFEMAADAIVSGDLATLKQLLLANPKLVLDRSMREHRATLLHYTSANGVEGYRQKTPKNIVAIAELLLKFGAEVDAEADVYRGGCTTLGLAATSVHPEAAGVQEALLQLLLDHGAVIDKPNLAGNRHSAVSACLANGRPSAAKFLVARGAQLDLESAAGIGRLETVKSYFDSEGNLNPPTTKQQLQKGFLWACMYGHGDVASFLLERGADLRDRADSGATALHWAAGGAHLDIVKLLLDRGAALEEINQWGGTVLEHAGWGFEHGNADAEFIPVFEALLSAGAQIRGRWLPWLRRVEGRKPDASKRIAELLRQYEQNRVR